MYTPMSFSHGVSMKRDKQPNSQIKSRNSMMWSTEHASSPAHTGPALPPDRPRPGAKMCPLDKGWAGDRGRGNHVQRQEELWRARHLGSEEAGG